MRFLYLFFVFSCFKGIAQEDYNNFLGTPVNIDQVAQLDKPYFLDYHSNDSLLIKNDIFKPIVAQIAEKIVSNKHKELFKNNSQDSIVNFIHFQTKLSFNYQGNLISMIKYKIKTDGVLSGIKIAKVQKGSSSWNEFENKELQEIENVFKLLTPEAFWEFYSLDNNLKYPEINKLKYMVKDEKGILNIEKLNEVIKNNKANLNSFLEN